MPEKKIALNLSKKYKLFTVVYYLSNSGNKLNRLQIIHPDKTFSSIKEAEGFIKNNFELFKFYEEIYIFPSYRVV